ncbi:MAG: LacI family transcriptional regulator [Phyllobacteriaceae bacterium]|nr:LacI family transcriptional regulator [Phyllobacteriaceae bacterium]
MQNDDTLVTLDDVATLAGVSRMTVSRVLNNRGGASQETQRRIREAASQLNYRPNAMARSLKSRRSQTVGVMVPDISNPFFPEIFRGAESIAQAHGYTLILSNVVESADREVEVLEKLLAQQVDGIIWCSARMPGDALAESLRTARQVVLVNRTTDPELARSVTVDYGLGARLAVEHLTQIGVRRVGIVAGPDWSYGARERLSGVTDALADCGVAAGRILHCDPTIDGGRMAAASMLADDRSIDGLICYNDLTAIGATQACRNLRIGVPDDLALLGFDDIDMAQLVTPTITSLGVERYEIGRAAMTLLLKLIEGRPAEDKIVLHPKLAVRGSTLRTAAQ